MKRIWICVIALIVAVAFSMTAVIATPDIAKKTGKPCSYCHKSPSGGKELTTAGQYYQKNKKLPPAKATKPAAKPGKKPAAKPGTKAGAGKGPSMTTAQHKKMAAHHYKMYRHHKAKAGYGMGKKGCPTMHKKYHKTKKHMMMKKAPMGK